MRWIFVAPPPPPPSSYAEALTAKVLAFGDGAFGGEVVRCRGCRLHDRMSVLTGGTPERWLPLSPHALPASQSLPCEDRARRQEESSPQNQTGGTLILGLLGLQNCEK